ncbi:MAG: SDR family NAD(P)-dependent oxidoreductase [Lysobacterales bacterium]
MTKTALITGATTGIGREIAAAFARDGVNLILVARDQAALNERVLEWRDQFGIEIATFACDLAVPGAADELADLVSARGAPIDYLVNNAGVGVYGTFDQTSLRDELAMITLNVVTPTVLCKRFLPQLMQRNGKILNVASIAAFQPGPYMAAYYATKAYLLNFSDALAAELAGSGVTVTTFCPGPTASGFQLRAAMQASRLVKGKTLADAASVGIAGYRAMQRGKRVVVPGWTNRLTTLITKFLPRAAVTRAIYRMSAPA